MESSDDRQISDCGKTGLLSSQRSRKGHAKSRKGCLNCKKARIKCKENRPVCDYCAHRKLQCRWPDVYVSQTQASSIIAHNAEIVISTPSIQVYHISTGPITTDLDFRLFNHFIDVAYPHQPAGNDAKWKHEIPCISSEFNYLLHAMLALSASDIASQTNDPSLTLTALTYRTQSIIALNTVVNKGITSSEAGNAMLATCFALLFQSTLLNDGLSEYMSFIRGCVAIGMAMAHHKYTFIFTGVFGDHQMQSLDPKMLDAPLLDASVVGAACRSLEKMRCLCVTKVEIEMFALLLNMARDLVTSSRDAYMTLRKIYALFAYHMPYAEFREFTDVQNRVCQLLQAHFVALQLVMRPLTRMEWEGRENATSGGGGGGDGKTVKWLGDIHKKMSEEMRGYYEWTLSVERESFEEGVLEDTLL